MDISGNPKTNYDYLGLVMGTIENITSLSNKLPITDHFSGMRNIPKNNNIQDLLDFDGENRIAFCIKFHKHDNYTNIGKQTRSSKRKIASYENFERNVVKLIKKNIEPFLLKHKVSVTTLTIQCDSDCTKFVNVCSWKKQLKGPAYKIADYVAWFNNHNKSIVGCQKIDLSTEIKNI